MTGIDGESSRTLGSEMDLDSIIDRLVGRAIGWGGVSIIHPTRIHLDESEILWLCMKVREIFLAQPALLHCDAPIKVH